MLNRLQPITSDEILSLVAVARREKPAQVWIKNALNANLFTGELERVHIAVDGKRIAYVGPTEPKWDDNTEIVEADAYTLVPGYIEPHAHPFQIYNPISLADYVLTKGTTTYIGDNMMFFNHLSLDDWIAFMEECAEHPVKILWWSRLDPQSEQKDLETQYKVENLQRNLQHPLVIQAGEMTQWINLFYGDKDIATKMALAKGIHKRIEGHAPGSSHDTLNALAAAGITADHEAITGEEVLRRLRLGYYVPLRHSSIRPDLPELLDGIRDLKYGWERLMLTTDGSTPPFIKEGFTDTLIRIGLEKGFDPMLVYRMATLNVATYYGLDEQIGSISSGRLADINFLKSIHDPTPQMVMVEGKIGYKLEQQNSQTKKDTINISWKKYDLEYKAYTGRELKPTDFHIPWEEERPFPVLQLLNDVITVQQDKVFVLENGSININDEDLLYIALVDRHGKWVTKGIIGGFAHGLDAIASTYTLSMDYIVIGRDYTAMAKAINYVMKESGIALVEGGEIYHLPLLIGGGVSTLTMEDLMTETMSLQQKLKGYGYRHNDPFYCLLFLSSTHLPRLRLTEDGLLSIKDRKILIPSNPINHVI